MMGIEVETVMEPRRYFSPMEANSIVPRLEYCFAEMARIQRSVNDIWKRAAGLGVDIDEKNLDDGEDDPVIRHVKRRLVELSEEFTEYVERIDTLGVVLEDIDHGIVRMFSWLDGDEVFLSWQYGETEVAFWHGVRENFIARRPLRSQAYTPVEPDMLH